MTSKRSGRVVMKYSFPEDRKATIAADWVVESVLQAVRRALWQHWKVREMRLQLEILSYGIGYRNKGPIRARAHGKVGA